MDKNYSAKIYGMVYILPKVDYNLDNICCEQLKQSLTDDKIHINLANNEFQINDIIIKNCPFCLSKLQVIQTDRFVDKDDKDIIWQRIDKK